MNIIRTASLGASFTGSYKKECKCLFQNQGPRGVLGNDNSQNFEKVRWKTSILRFYQ